MGLENGRLFQVIVDSPHVLFDSAYTGGPLPVPLLGTNSRSVAPATVCPAAIPLTVKRR